MSTLVLPPKRSRLAFTTLQTYKAARVAGYSKDTVFLNKYMSIENKVQIYKTMVRLVTMYALEARWETEKNTKKVQR